MGWTTADIPDLHSRTAVVTGANGGLGFETARELARKGAHIVMAVRNLDKATAARDTIAREVPGAALELAKLDLGSLASVRAAAATILDAHPVIDILVRRPSRTVRIRSSPPLRHPTWRRCWSTFHSRSSTTWGSGRRRVSPLESMDPPTWWMGR